ncbi:MAG: PilZ domain-containing protein [Desulfobulbaceae bacterium]|nr:PilZ domain-containing protein [Desulfobulbaceae bacterium]
MSVEYRRSKRIIDYIPLEVYAVQGKDRQPIAGPFSGRIIDISTHGACLLMTQVFYNGFHIFHSTRDTSDSLLQLTINQPPDLNDCQLTAVPVWLDLFRQQEIRAFKMGIDFTESPEAQQMKDLQKALQENQETRAGWWLAHCKIWDRKR